MMKAITKKFIDKSNAFLVYFYVYFLPAKKYFYYILRYFHLYVLKSILQYGII